MASQNLPNTVNFKVNKSGVIVDHRKITPDANGIVELTIAQDNKWEFATNTGFIPAGYSSWTALTDASGTFIGVLVEDGQIAFNARTGSSDQDLQLKVTSSGTAGQEYEYAVLLQSTDDSGTFAFCDPVIVDRGG